MTSSSRNTRCNRNGGFTLIELLVVISIIVIVSAASIPMGLNFVRHYQVMGAAQNVAAQIQRGRAEAVKRNARRGILLNLNYPGPGQFQWTSLEPSPETLGYDGGVYPVDPGNFDPNVPNYGTVPTPPDNLNHPNIGAGVMSPHGPVVDLAQDLGFQPGASNAFLFRADGSVMAVTTAGPSGAGVITANGLNWQLVVEDPRTNLTRTLTVSRNGRVTITNP